MPRSIRAPVGLLLPCLPRHVSAGASGQRHKPLLGRCGHGYALQVHSGPRRRLIFFGFTSTGLFGFTVLPSFASGDGDTLIFLL